MSGNTKEEIIRKNNDVASTAAFGTGDGAQVIDYREVGATGLRRFSGFIYEEFLQELTGWKGVAIFKEMQYNDATVAAVLFAIRSLCRRVKWMTEPASQDPEDQEAAEFLETAMNDMSQPWVETIDEILTMLGYGYSVHEIVYKRRCGDVLDPTMRSKYCDGRIGWRKLPIRSQDTIYRWQFDDHGGIQGVEQLAPPHYYHVTIPVEKFLLFRTTIEKNNPEGRSLLRGAYRSWYMKKNIENIEAIGVERDLAGLPIMEVPPELMSKNADANQKALLGALKDIVINVRRNSQEGLIMPLQYNEQGKPLYNLKLLSTGGTRQFDTNQVINRYDNRIAMTMLADFMLMGQEKVGSFALSSTKTNLFSTAIGGFLDIIADVFNRFAIPRLFALNDFELSDYPKLIHGDLGTVDLKEIGAYIQQLAQSGMPLFPNADLEQYLLEAANMPAGSKKAERSEDIPVDNVSANGKAQVTVPGLPLQTPTNGGGSTVASVEGINNDTTPVNGKPPVQQVYSDAGGDTEVTSRVPNVQDEEQFYNPNLGPQS